MPNYQMNLDKDIFRKMELNVFFLLKLNVPSWNAHFPGYLIHCQFKSGSICFVLTLIGSSWADFKDFYCDL